MLVAILLDPGDNTIETARVVPFRSRQTCFRLEPLDPARAACPGSPPGHRVLVGWIRPGLAPDGDP
jgi:hypothetical protein